MRPCTSISSRDTQSASFRAVSPRASRFSNVSTRLPRLRVKFCSRKAWSLKVTMKVSSSRLLSPMNTRAALATRSLFSRMLPLVSITSPTLMGTSSWRKREISCSTPSSKTRKCSCSSPCTGSPSRSSTDTGSNTSSTSTMRVNWPSSPRSCAEAVANGRKTRSAVAR